MAIVVQNDIPGKICANPDCGWKPLSEFGIARSHGHPVRDGYKSRCRDCFNAQKRAERAAKPEQYRASAQKYVQANLEHIREIKRAHQKAHPERYTEASRKWCDAHRQEINANARERRLNNLEHHRKIARDSYERHAQERCRYSLEYYKRYPEKSVAATNRRRARKLAAGGSHTEQEWKLLKAAYGYKCLCCGKREPEIRLTRDHVKPLTMGGTDAIGNIQPLCARCNSKKNNKHIDYR